MLWPRLRPRRRRYGQPGPLRLRHLGGLYVRHRALLRHVERLSLQLRPDLHQHQRHGGQQRELRVRHRRRASEDTDYLEKLDRSWGQKKPKDPKMAGCSAYYKKPKVRREDRGTDKIFTIMHFAGRTPDCARRLIARLLHRRAFINFSDTARSSEACRKTTLSVYGTMCGAVTTGCSAQPEMLVYHKWNI